MILEGGGRRPGEPARFAWEVLRASPSAGRCPACGMPMLGDGPVVPYRIELPEGFLVVGEHLEGPAGPLTVVEAERLVDDQLPLRGSGGAGALAFSSLAVAFVGILGLWFVGGLGFFLWFLWFGSQNGAYLR